MVLPSGLLPQTPSAVRHPEFDVLLEMGSEGGDLWMGIASLPTKVLIQKRGQSQSGKCKALVEDRQLAAEVILIDVRIPIHPGSLRVMERFVGPLRRVARGL
jgi:hypothetical protein